jgi:very-short-patch-repair endonuclease
VSHPQDALFKNVRDLFKKPTYQEVIFEFNIFRRYDIVVPDLKLEIEYDGPQHFKFNKFFHHTKSEFEDSKAVDILKENLLRGHGYTVLRFSDIEDVESADYIRKKLALKGFKNE